MPIEVCFGLGDFVPKIFVNYRRDDVKADARGITQVLTARYGAAGVFMDVRNLSGGQVFDQIIADELAICDVLIAVIGPNWMPLLKARMASGSRDLLREEIAAALGRGLIVLPVLIDRAHPPRAEELPEDIRALVARETEEVRHKYFDRDMEDVIAVIEARRAEVMRAPRIVPQPVAAAVPAAEPFGAAEREWRQFELDSCEDAGLLKAYAEKWTTADPPWAYKAARKVTELEAQRRQAEARRAEQERLAQERGAFERRLAAFHAEGRIPVDAATFHGDSEAAKAGWLKPGAGKTEWFKDNDVGPEMVVVPAGNFTMGSPADEPDGLDSEAQVPVTIASPFAVGRCAVTRGEFAAFVQATGYAMPGAAAVGWTGSGWQQDAKYSWRNPGFPQDDRHPVVCVNWDDAQAYVTWLREVTGKPYRLLSEAEWEYTARAGTTTPFWWGTAITPAQANYDGNYSYAGGAKGVWRKGTVPVDYAQEQFRASQWGLHQVHGNVLEWCADCWNEKNEGNPGDGSARTTGDYSVHVLRGGSWSNDPGDLRAAFRSGGSGRGSDSGFRVGRFVVPPRTL